MSGRGSFAAVYPTLAELNREIAGIRRVLVRCGVRSAEQADLVQEVLIAAWRQTSAGGFRPDPGADPTAALRAWLNRIAYHKADHYRQSAWQRRAQLAGLEPRDLVPEPSIHPLDFLEARDELAAVRHLNRSTRAALLAFAAGSSFEEIGAELGVPVSLAVHLTELGRNVLAEITGREGAT